MAYANKSDRNRARRHGQPDGRRRPRRSRDPGGQAPGIFWDRVSHLVLALRRRLRRPSRRDEGDTHRPAASPLARRWRRLPWQLRALCLAVVIAICVGGLVGLLQGRAGSGGIQGGQAGQAGEGPQAELTDSLSATVGYSTLRATSSTRNLAQGDLTDIERALARLRAEGINASIDLETIDRSLTLSYRETAGYYSASCIKGLYAVALYQRRIDTGKVPLSSVQQTVEQMIENSDNSAYMSLWLRYRNNFLGAWLNDNNVSLGIYDTREDYLKKPYPTSTPEQLRQAWRSMYAYLTSNEGNSASLATFFQERSVSPIKDVLEAKGESNVTSMSKAGWCPKNEGSDDEPASNDAGVVIRSHDEGKSYVVAIMSDASSDLDALKPLIKAVDDFVCNRHGPSA